MNNNIVTGYFQSPSGKDKVEYTITPNINGNNATVNLKYYLCNPNSESTYIGADGTDFYIINNNRHEYQVEYYSLPPNTPWTLYHTHTYTVNYKPDGTLKVNIVYGYKNRSTDVDILPSWAKSGDVNIPNISNGHIKINNIWKNAWSWFKTSSGWKRCIIWRKINGVWKKGK